MLLVECWLWLSLAIGGPGERCVTDFGAVPDDDHDDTAAIQRAIDQSRSGETVRFGGGVYRLDKSLLFRSDRSYRGDDGATLRFHVPKDTYGIIVQANASNVLIENLKLVGAGIRLTDGERYRDIRIVGNDISACAPGTRGVYATTYSEGLVVEHNFFHDYDEWGAVIYHMNRGSYSNNRFENITQGAHIVNPYDDVHVSFNSGRKLHRMGLEIQQFTADGRPTNDLTVEGNVFADWTRPFWESFGLSVMPQNGFNVRVINNYVAATHEGPWGRPDSDGHHRYGYGIEAGFRSGVVENNVVAGPWCNHVVVSMPDTPVRNNRLFGKPFWRLYVTGEPGLTGRGNAIEAGNTIEPDMRKCPPAPTTSPSRAER